MKSFTACQLTYRVKHGLRFATNFSIGRVITVMETLSLSDILIQKYRVHCNRKY